jgi:3-hydroxyacyl-CoA dehydrogenase/3a,7a,12a-trihydroxy-5b-cholest-24-enoyl-CoA hydratase
MMRVYLERGEGKALVPKVSAVFNFEVKKDKKGPVVKTFTIDLS